MSEASALGKPGLVDDQPVLSAEAASFCASQGILMAVPKDPNAFVHAPVSLLPNDFPASQYHLAVQLATLFNTLVSGDAGGCCCCSCLC